jgi:hypothetical protein
VRGDGLNVLSTKPLSVTSAVDLSFLLEKELQDKEGPHPFGEQFVTGRAKVQLVLGKQNGKSCGVTTMDF